MANVSVHVCVCVRGAYIMVSIPGCVMGVPLWSACGCVGHAWAGCGLGKQGNLRTEFCTHTIYLIQTKPWTLPGISQVPIRRGALKIWRGHNYYTCHKPPNTPTAPTLPFS